MKRFRHFKPKAADGFRSGLERVVAEQLRKAGVKFQYETLAIPFEKPVRPSKYIPDFILPNGVIVETKGYMTSADRTKHRLIKEQHGDRYDVRFVFSNSKTKIGKKSTTTYADWCRKFGFLFADREIPASWLEEVSKKP